LAGVLALALVPDGAAAKTPAEQFSAFAAGSEVRVDHGAWDRLLKAYVAPDGDRLARVDYARFKREGHAALKSYIEAVSKTDVAALDRPEQFAFWANLYNAKTIDLVLDAYPIASIKDIRLGGGLVATITGGPWKAKVLTVGGRELSLDDIEHGILRPVFKDPRVHYAVNCASVGCPNLGVEAFRGDKLQAQLDSAARAYVNHPRGVSVDDGAVTVSSIYSWFRDDFGGNDASVLDHIRSHVDEALKQKLVGITEIADDRYDWSLNDTANPGGR
jgi:hypothetical protein